MSAVTDGGRARKPVSGGDRQPKRKRPPTFTCAWCQAVKPLARTGRMPRFCSDYCRRQPEAAERGLDVAKAQRDHAARLVEHYTAALARYRALEAAETR